MAIKQYNGENFTTHNVDGTNVDVWFNRSSGEWYAAVPDAETAFPGTLQTRVWDMYEIAATMQHILSRRSGPETLRAFADQLLMFLASATRASRRSPEMFANLAYMCQQYSS